LKLTGKNCSFEVGVYRPPSEGGSHSLLIRFTRNCPWNHCTFCGMYKDNKFQLRSVEEIKKDIDSIEWIRNEIRSISKRIGHDGHVTRQAMIQLLSEAPRLNHLHGFDMVCNWLVSGGKTAFLQDANSLLMKTENLVAALTYLRKTFSSIERVTSYARSKTLSQKPMDDLRAIRMAGLDRLHVGLETGDDELLKKINKGVTAEGHIKGGKKAIQAGFQLSEYWMPGLGGKALWKEHAAHTAHVLNEINPHYIRSRPIFPAPGTPLHRQCETGEFVMLSPHEQLTELRTMIEALEVTSRVCFDHAGNYWRDRNGRLLFSQSYEGYQFPEMKPQVLRLIEEGLAVKTRRPRLFRL